jgi:branched-chain amino acid transport system ATP-binding protein
MKCIMGILPPSAGSIVAEIDGVRHDLIGRSTEEIVDLGIALVPEGRRLFPKLTVAENLLLGAFRRTARAALARNLEMLALGRALMLAPKILLIDEPSVGLAPILVARTIDAIAQMKARYNLTVLMAEQNFTQAIRIADRGYVIVHGKIAFEGVSAAALNNNDLIKKFYLGL